MSVEDNRGNDLSKYDECTVESEGTGREVAIQTNPHEIERSQGQLPFRKRFIPVRFSDYGIFADNVKEEDDEIDVMEDADFVPTETVHKQTPNNKDDRQKRSRGRPRKSKDTSNVSTSADSESAGHENVKRNPITKVSNGFKCGVCSKIFTLRGNAKTHLITHTNDRPFRCDFKGCDKSLRTKESLRRHRLSHLGVKTFECSECNKKFSCNLSLQEHMTRHTGQKPLNCDICGTKFRQIAVLKRHLTTHSNSKPFECEICGKKFSLKVYVRSHMKTHTGERPFACDVCNKCFAHASDLNRHKIIHSGKKPYQCSICPMRYSDPSSRRRHEREHESKPQYVCHLCKQQFPRAGQLRVHLVKEHTSTTAALDQHSVIQFPIKIEPTDNQNGKSSLAWYPGVEIETNNSSSPGVMNVQSAVVQTTMATSSNSGTGVGLGQEVNTVQIVLDSSCAGQGGDVKEISQAPLQGDIQSDAVQTVVMELPQNSEDFPGLEGNGAAYKVINTGNRVFEIRVKEPSQETYQVQDLSNEMKINVSDLKMNDGGLVAFIQDGDTVTVMEQTDENPQQANSNNNGTNFEIVAQTSGDENNINMVVSNVGEMLEHSNSDNVPSVQKEGEQDSDLVRIPIEQQENLNLMKEGQVSVVEHCVSSGVSQAEMTPTKIYPNNENQNVPQDYEIINDNDSSSADIQSSIITVPSSAIYSPFIENPDLNSQDYYNWLSSFSEECKHFVMPLSKEIFTKISQIQKTLSDFMAMPTGVITDRNNFKILMGINQDLSQITSSHLLCMYSNLNS